MGRKTYLFHQNLRKSNGCKVGYVKLKHLVKMLGFLNLNDKINEDPQYKIQIVIYIFIPHVCEKFKFGGHIHILELVKVH
jgi:hypothetical protein